MDTVINMAHEFGINVGYWPEVAGGGDADTRIRHNEMVMMKLERHIGYLCVGARQRGDVSMKL